MTNERAYGENDPRDLPAYGFAEAAHYLSIPKATLRSWALGQRYHVGDESRVFKPILRIPDSEHKLLSFFNIVEAHVLDGLRRDHEISLQKIRTALDYLARSFPSEHPLAEHRFVTSGIDLFVEKYGGLIQVSQEGQMAMKQVLQAYLRRVERDEKGNPIRLFPFTRRKSLEEPRAIVIDPWVSFGKPVLAGTGIPTVVIAERYKGGESIDDLASDYDRSRLEIEEAIRCELEAA